MKKKDYNLEKNKPFDLKKHIEENYQKSSLTVISFFELRRSDYYLEPYLDQQLIDVFKELNFDLFGQSGVYIKNK